MGKLSGKFIFTKCIVPEAGTFFNSLFEKRLWHKCFPVNFVEFLRTPFLQNTSGRLLLFFKIYVRTSFCAVQFRQSPDGFNLKYMSSNTRKQRKCSYQVIFNEAREQRKCSYQTIFNEEREKENWAAYYTLVEKRGVFRTQSVSCNTAFLWR